MTQHSPVVRTVLGPDEIARALTRIAHEILEANHGSDDLVILGIPTRGVHLAARLASRLSEITGEDFDARTGALDITMHRDDLRDRPTRASHPTRIPASGIDDKVVVLVDDVLYSGRTIRAALDALADFGRPRAVRLAVLVDRGHRELPIRADSVGKNLPSARSEHVSILLQEIDGEDAVVIEGGAA
ncbi:bifunctional pyr operon transcriptional regulator/uracil phosphoribosyltransferase PyrR [Agrococcus sp. Marseille-P2731]|uniref:bifunctional pyr operon transcriptional regulator/uracil phosphoribosyltransferase PyrR n=1 Tax=Agrococcus sp. Marseille-P2731 TaxID=1841862 RepID=UPI000931665C|nr:bifunctional pyr operon transcriptional regulator/uracil phosphoribosyltransferase PyrR [Agrococcus sp. Marseille-P2731]